MRFEWDENKRLINIRRHGIDFIDAEILFESETYTVVDERFDYGEMRLLTLGIANGRILAVTHLEDDDLIRIISVRKAERYEQEIYFTKIRD